MAALPIPPPPELAQQQPPPGPGMADRMGQLRQQPGGQNLSAQGVQQLDLEVKKLAEQVMTVAQMASTLHRPLLGDLSKMAEIGMSLQGQMKDLLAKQQGTQGAAPPAQPQAPSPTDAAPGA